MDTLSNVDRLGGGGGGEVTLIISYGWAVRIVCDVEHQHPVTEVNHFFCNLINVKSRLGKSVEPEEVGYT